MEVNLCPSISSGHTSCSIGSEIYESVYVKEESLAVVDLGLDHCVAVVCCEDGETQYSTVTPKRKEDFPDNISVYGNNNSAPSPPPQTDFTIISGFSQKRNIEEIRGSFRKKFKQWSENAMAMAIEHVRNGMKIRAAAEKFKVPRSTLGDRLLMAKYGCRTSSERNHKRGKSCYYENEEMRNPKPLMESVKNENVEALPFPHFEEKYNTATTRQLDKNQESVSLLNMESSILSEDSETELEITCDVKPHISHISSSTLQTYVDTSDMSRTTEVKPEHLNGNSRSRETYDNTFSESDDETRGFKKFRLWNEQNMNNAIEAVTKEGMAMRTAAKTYGVPRTTLTQWVSRGDPVTRCMKKKWSEERMNQALEAIKSSNMPVRVAARKFDIPKSTLYDRILKEDEMIAHHVFKNGDNKNKTSDALNDTNNSANFHNPKTPDKKKTCDITSVNFKNNNINITNEYDDMIVTNKGHNAQLSNVPANIRNADLVDANKMPVISMVYSLREEVSSLPDENTINSKASNRSKTKDVLSSDQKKESAPTVYTAIVAESTANKKQNAKSVYGTTSNEAGKQESKVGVVLRERKKWTEESMYNAVIAVENGSCIRNAALKFGVPRSTLGDRLISYRRNYGISKSNHHDRFAGAPILHENLVNEKPEECELQLSESPESSPRSARVVKEEESASLNGSSGNEGYREPDERMSCSPEREDGEPFRQNPRNDNTIGAQEIMNSAQESNSEKAKKKRVWSEENMEKAIDAVEQGMPIRHASKQFAVPRTTLACRRLKREASESLNGPAPHLNREDEDRLISYINHCATFGFRNIRKVTLMLAEEAALKNGIGGSPSDKWWDSFCSRNKQFLNHPVLCPPPTEETSAREEMRESLDVFYEKLHSFLTNINSQGAANYEDCIFTAQETKHDVREINMKMPMGFRSDYTALPINPERFVSTICCVSSTGYSFPPMFVYLGAEDFQATNVGHNGPAGSVHCEVSGKGNDFYLMWFKDTFLKHAPTNRPLILLLDPDTAIVSPELIKVAHENKVILLCFSQHFTDLLQPISRTVLPALKTGFNYYALRTIPNAQRVKFSNFSHCFKMAWDASVSTTTIKLGFKLAGICPLDKGRCLQR